METCLRCNGYGKETCGVCWGGQKKIYCMGCSGRGYNKNELGEEIICKRCNGHKVYIPLGCQRCSNSYPCPDCNGTGQI